VDVIMKRFLLFFLSIAGLTAPLAADCDSCCEPYCGSSSCYPSGGCCDDPCCTAWDGGDEPWGGFYIGGFGGYGWGRVKTSSSPASPLFANKLDARGALAGALVGWNYQWCDWVAGVEADFAWCNLKKSTSNSLTIPLEDPLVFTVNAAAHQRFLGTVRARIGYNWCNTLLYATGGLAYGNAKYDITASVTSSELSASQSFSNKKTRTGWTVGAGIEKLIWCNWSVKLEYLYYDLGRVHLSAPGTTARLNWKTQIHTLKAGINYHF
jgi:outer membrane immunogenic protein